MIGISGALKVRIHPDLKSRVPWINLPVVQAPSPFDRSRNISLAISEEFIIRNFQIKRRVPIFQAWVHLVGYAPPIAGVDRLVRDQGNLRLWTIRDALACFRGVNRPYGLEPDGSSILAYVIRAPHTITYEPNLACVGKWTDCPTSTVLVAYVAPRDDLANLQDYSNKIGGVILRWEFVPSDASASDLPENYGKRYLEKLW
jgi:hypothetical protein